LKSSTTTRTDIFVPSARRPTSPGEMLAEEFLSPMRLTQQELADAVGVTRVRINEIINGRRGITADTALRLSRALGTSVDFWLRLQMACDVFDALRSPRAKSLSRIRRVGRVA